MSGWTLGRGSRCNTAKREVAVMVGSDNADSKEVHMQQWESRKRQGRKAEGEEKGNVSFWRDEGEAGKELNRVKTLVQQQSTKDQQNR